VTRARPAIAAGAVALAGGLPESARVLTARGLTVETLDGDGVGAIVAAIARGAPTVAAALAEPPDPDVAAELAPSCRAAAEAGHPVVLLVPAVRSAGRVAVERAAALAYLRAHGAILLSDPDAWIETTVLCARAGVPPGPRTAVVAPPGSWIEAAARSLSLEAESHGGRGPTLTAIASELEPTDVVLVDRASLAEVPARARALALPVSPRGELAEGFDGLVGLRAALAAVAAAGRCAERIAVGLGPAPIAARAELEIDEERLRRQLDKLGTTDRRLGDHEAKVFLAAYGVPVTRQAVATTPSAATNVAKKAGYPVEIKPWGPDVPTERAGCPVEKNVTTASEVRRAFGTVLGAAGLPVSETSGSAVIVRETPPAGREVSASFLRVAPLGWTVLLEVAGVPGPLAAPAPLRLVDATALAAAVTSSRAGDPDPDRVALANLLRRASHLAVDHDALIDRLELVRITVAPKGARTLVIDAELHLR
jgi:hypothetical protein